MNYTAVDLFSGCGGLSEGIRQAGFDIRFAVEIDTLAADCYKENHPETTILTKDIRNIRIAEINKILDGRFIHLLAGCPPCQGFSSMRRLNKKRAVRDNRNNLILEYLRFVVEMKPLTVMMENVPGLRNYYLFRKMVRELEHLDYYVDHKVVDIKDYGVPQRRKRLVMIGSKLAPIKVAEPIGTKLTVRDVIGNLDSVEITNDPLHKIVANHTKRIQELIRLIPQNGGSRKDLPAEYHLLCHKKPNVGFKDIYGRLKWDDYSSTITGGCLNPSKGRFLHPEEDRALTPREAALIQTFPSDYKFPMDIPKADLALMIGNALPPEFSRIQTTHILEHIKRHNG